ncbi:MAG: 50S ribosomal protein L9 [Actinomycetota bacterium]|nr:50S ribosomal protein L9 [Actinomycetota bacterium]
MEVILLRDVEKLGLRGEVVNVARGYARNYLVPRRLAEPASAGRIAELKRIEAHRARHEARSVEHAREIAALLERTVLRFEVQAGPTGTLFGSVTATDVADEIWRTRKVRVDRRRIGLDEPIKRIGRYSVPIEVFTDVSVEVNTLVVPEGGELPPEGETGPDAAAAQADGADDASALASAHDADLAADELEPGGEEAAAGVPDDDFDRALDTAIEREGEEL